MKKLAVVLVVFLAFILCLGGCNRQPEPIMLGENEATGSGYYSISYLRFTGERKYTFFVKEATFAEIKVATIAGRLDIELFGYDDVGTEHSLYYGEKLETGISEVYLEPGEYTIVLYGVKHNGSTQVSYN